MDTIALVDEQVDAGRLLVGRLAQEGFPVSVAGWVKLVEEDRWTLHIASRLVDDKGPTAAYRHVYRVLRSLESPWITDSDITLIGEKHPITRDLLEIRQRHPTGVATRAVHNALGSLPVEEVHVYPPIPVFRRPDLGKRRLKKDVRQMDRPEDYLLTPQEKVAVGQLVAQGMSELQARGWVRERREKQMLRPRIPAGTVVKAWVTAYWGDKPEDDPNPLLQVEAPDGAQGLVFKDDTEPA